MMLRIQKTIDVEMRPVSCYNTTIAPAFSWTHFNICSPLKTYSLHIKVKIWLVLFCCMTTSPTSMKVMKNYSAIVFVQAFTGFNFEVRYSQFMLRDKGSKLVKVFESMMLKSTYIRKKLHTDTFATFWNIFCG